MHGNFGEIKTEERTAKRLGFVVNRLASRFFEVVVSPYLTFAGRFLSYVRKVSVGEYYFVSVTSSTVLRYLNCRAANGILSGLGNP